MKFQIKPDRGPCGLIVLSICLALLHTESIPAATQPVSEFWISTAATGTNGAGAKLNPYDGSTAANFSRVLGNLPVGATLHILPGTYQTYGNTWDGQGWNLKSGQKIMGSGMEVTILQLVPNAPDGTVMLASFGAGVSNVVVSDLTCDANYISGTPVSYNGISIVGSKNTVRNVKVINLAHYGGNSEAWGIHLGSVFSSQSASVGNLIEGCEVSQYKGFGAGSAITAIAMNGTNGAPASGIIRSNKVFLTAITDNNQHAIGVGADCVVQGNYVDSSGEGVYSDTGLEGTEKLTITHNTFKNVLFGVSLRTFKKNVTVSYNTVTLSTNICFQYAFWFPHDCGYFLEYPAVNYTNISIIGNTVRFEGQAPPSVYPFFLQAKNVSGLTVTGNKIEGTLKSQFIDCSKITLQNNLDLSGRTITNLMQVKPPTGMRLSNAR